MSTDTPTSDAEGPESRSISLTWEPETEMWNAVDEDLGVASCGETREEALEMLDEAVALYKGEAGHEPTDEELREIGVDPENNESGSLEDSEIFE